MRMEHIISIIDYSDGSESGSKTAFLLQIMTLMNMTNPVLSGHAGGEVKMTISRGKPSYHILISLREECVIHNQLR